MKLLVFNNKDSGDFYLKNGIAGAIALEIGWGGISKVEESTGMSHSTISRGIEELKTSEKLKRPERLRDWYEKVRYQCFFMPGS